MSGPLMGRQACYVPYSTDLVAPGDRRRFVWYAARRDVAFELADRPPAPGADVVYLTTLADISSWVRHDGSSKVVFELIDSYLAEPRLSVRSVFRGLARWGTGGTAHLLLNYRRGLERMCRRADAVVCSTEEQRQLLLEHCDNVHVILDAHDELVGGAKASYEGDGALRLLWEGLPQNVVGFRALEEPLRDIGVERAVRLDLVTDRRTARWMGRYGWRSTTDLLQHLPVEVELHDWTPATLVDAARRSDLAVIPLTPGDPFALGKPENKLLIFWRMGVPAIVSATPAYRRAMAAAGVPSDMACATAEDWRHALRRYGNDPQARADAARAGLAYVTREHSEERLLERWDALFRSIV